MKAIPPRLPWLKAFLSAAAFILVVQAVIVFAVLKYYETKFAEYGSLTRSQVEFIFGGAENFAAVSNPDEVRIHRIARHISYEVSTIGPEAHIGEFYLGYPVFDGSLKLTGEDTTIVTDLFSEAANYHAMLPHLCIFNPAYIADFIRGERTVSLLLDEHPCREFRIYVDGERIPYNTLKSGIEPFPYIIASGVGRLETPGRFPAHYLLFEELLPAAPFGTWARRAGADRPPPQP